MTKIIEKKVRKSPILVSRFYKDWDTQGKKKMIKMSIKKLKKIGDPESLLCRAVLINNTLESVKSKKYPVPSDQTLERSQYNEDEERILNKVILPCYVSPGLSFHDNKGSVSSGYNTTITLPEPITPLSDDEESDPPLVNLKQDKTSEKQDESSRSLQADEYHRALFNSYLSLCSTEKYDCNSVMAA